VSVAFDSGERSFDLAVARLTGSLTLVDNKPLAVRLPGLARKKLRRVPEFPQECYINLKRELHPG
jgi:hypothetical protein